MNKKLHRIIFNAARGCRMVVAESATAHGKAAGGHTDAPCISTASEARELCLGFGMWLATSAGAVLGAIVLVVPTVAQAQIKADPSAPGNQRPTILSTANGVPQVNIQTPSAAGVSRNTYSQFDVQAQGAILNNSTGNVQTQLGGWIAGNPSVAAGAARVILNEVNSSNPSYLKGYVEVAGSKAEVIIANPAGIQVNGGGFINAGTVTLTTGTPVMNSGNLESYRVSGGRIQIEGLGLDTRTASTTQILTRAAEINAGLWANYLKVVTGANQINAADPTGETSGSVPVPIAASTTEPKPRFALDVAAIGGMYAGHIYLIGTENGLGVNTKGSLYATAGDIVLQANGWLTSNAAIQASGNISIKTAGSSDSTSSGSGDGTGLQAAHGVANSGTIYAAGSTTLQADGDIGNTGSTALIAAQGDASVQAGATGSASSAGSITNTGTIAAGVLADGSMATNGKLTLGATGHISNSGKAYAGAALSLNADSLSNQAGAQIMGGAATSITTTHATANSGQIQGADTTVQAASLSNAGTLYAKGRLAVQTSGDISNSSTALIAAQGDASVQSVAGSINNAGTLAAGVQTDGTVGSTGTLSLTAAGDISNSGTAWAGDTLSVGAANLDNSATGQLAATNTLITASNTFTNRGLVDGANTRIDAGALRNVGTGRIYGDTLSIGTTSLSNEAETVTDTTSGVVTTKAAVIAARQRLDIGVGTLANGYADGQGALIYSAGDMAIGGSLDGNRQATGSAQSISNAGGTITAMGQLTASAARISNTNPDFAYEIKSAGSTAEREYITSSGQLYTPSQVAWLLYTNWGSAGGGGGFAYGGAQGRFLPVGHTYADTKFQPYYGSGNAYVAARTDRTYDVESGTLISTTYTPDSFGYTAADPVWAVFGVTAPTGGAPGARPYASCNEFGCYNPTPAELATWDAAAAPWLTLQSKLDTFRASVNTDAIAYATWRELSRDIPQAVVTRSTPGKISAAGDMTLNATGSLLNEQSQIIAGGLLKVTGAAINNQAKSIDTSAARSGTQYTWDGGFNYGCGGKSCQRYSAYRPTSYSDDIPLTLSLNTASASASQAGVNQGIVQIPAASNSAGGAGGGASVIRTTDSGPGLATAAGSSLFRPTPTPGASYLVETDPRFTQYRTWLGSDYMTDALGYDPATVQKRLGDGFYEQTLVREQVAQLTGRRFLSNFQNDEQQFKALMNAGITYAKQFNLRPGITLTAEQVARLTSDMVWLVEREVTLADGSTQKALVPQLYAMVREGDLTGNGALLGGANVQIDAASLLNSGTIQGRKVVNINAQTVANLAGDIQAQSVGITTAGDLSNVGGAIRAEQDLQLQAGGSITVASAVASTASKGNGSASRTDRTDLTRVAGLYVTGPGGTLVASAEKDINAVAGIIQSAGDASLNAAGNVKLQTAQTSRSYQNDSETAHIKDSNRAEVGSQVSAAGNLSISAGQDISARAASIQAGTSGTGDVSLQADKDITLAAGQQSGSYDYTSRSSTSGLLSSTSTEERRTGSSAVAITSQISGANVSVSAGRDLTSVGTQFKANGDNSGNGRLTVEGKNSQAFYEAVNVEQSSSETKSSTSLLGISLGERSVSDSSLQTTAVASRLTSTDRIDVQVGNKATLQGAEVQAKDISFTQADPAKAGELVLASSISTSQTSHTEKSETAGVWQAQSGQGGTTQTASLTKLEGKVTIDPNLKVTVSTGSSGSTAPAQASLNSQIQSLSSQPGLGYLSQLSSNPNVKWEQVKLAHEQWSYSQQGLTPAGAALLSIAIAAATGGMGVELLGSTTTTAATATTAAASTTTLGGVTLATSAGGLTAAGAALNAGFSALAAQASVAMVNNGGDLGRTLEQLGSEQGIKGILTAMATAGAIEALNPGSVPTSTGQSGQAAQVTSTAQAANDFLGNLQRNITNNLAGAVVDSAINGKPLNEATLSSALTSALVTAGMAQGANSIGDLKQGNTLNSYTQAVAHAVLGCVAGAASSSGGCGAGALGGVVGELTAKFADEAGISKNNALALAKTMSAAAGVLAGGGGSNVAAVNVAAQTGANAAMYNRQLHPTETQKTRELAAQAQQSGLRKADGSAYTAKDFENAMRNSGNKALGESVSTGMVVNVNDKNGVYDPGAAFTVGQDEKTIVQQLPNGGRVDAQLAAFIQAQTGGAASPYSWQDQQLGKVSPPTADPNANIKMQTDPNWNYMGAKSAGMPSGVTTDNRAQSQIDKSLQDTTTGIALLPAVGAALVVAPEAAAVSGAVNSAAQVIKGQGFSPTEAAISTIMGPVGAAATEAQVVKTVIEQGGKAAIATNAGIGAATNVTGDTTAKILKGEEVTATGAAQAVTAGAVGGLPKSPVLQSITTEAANAAPQIYETVIQSIDKPAGNGDQK